MATKYNLAWLQEEFAQHPDLEFLLFWGHTPNKDGSMGKACLSQWWPSLFSHEGRSYSSTEQWMMAGKAKVFDDEATFEAILAEDNPKKVKALGRQVSPFDPQIWNEHKYAIVREGNWLKFSQNDEMRDYLLGTGESVLVEASPFDRIWGIGMGANHPEARNPAGWKGQNLLGFALMEVRDTLREGR